MILYAPSSRRDKKKKKVAPKRPDVQLMLEYLSREWVLVACYEPKCGGHGKLPLYYNDFYADLTGKFPLVTLMAAADVCVTDFREEAFAFAATGRPLLPFAADFATRIPALNLRDGWDRVFWSSFTGDTAGLIEEIRKTENAEPRMLTVFDCADCSRRTAEALRDIIAKTGSSI